MPSQEISYQDATVVVHAGVFGGGVSIDVTCRNFVQTGMTPSQFAALIYPAINAAAAPLDTPPTPPETAA